MNYRKTSSNLDPVITYTSEDGFYRITKRPSQDFWTLKRISLTNILGTVIGTYSTLEEAMNA